MLSRAPRMTETIVGLGYPLYVMSILGIAKVLGAAAILLGERWPTVKEWAYAGFMFDVIGALVSHLAHGDSLLIVSVPVLFLLAQAISYFSWKYRGQDALVHSGPRGSVSSQQNENLTAART